MSLIIVMGILIFIILPSTIFYFIEDNWTYLDCLYYTFVSLTTIGFGDLTTAQEQEKLGMWMFAYKGFSVMWLIFGLSFVNMNNTLLADRIKKISNRLGNFSIIPLFMPIPTDTKEDEEREMNILTPTARRVSDPGISFSSRGSPFNSNLQIMQIARGRSLKIPAFISYDVSEDNKGLHIINDTPNRDLIDLRKKCGELRRANEALQVTNNAIEAELITLRKDCMELRKANDDLQITNNAAKAELITLKKKCQLGTDANEALLVANYAAEDELVYQRKSHSRLMKTCISNPISK